jgi:hypothetical protein
VGPTAIERYQSPAEIRAGIVHLRACIETLEDLADRHQTDHPAGDRHHVLVIDDLPRTLRCLDADATQALKHLLAYGRAVGFHVLAGGPRCTPSWVADQATVRISSAGARRGRVTVDDGQSVTEAQVIYLTGFEASAWLWQEWLRHEPVADLAVAEARVVVGFESAAAAAEWFEDLRIAGYLPAASGLATADALDGTRRVGTLMVTTGPGRAYAIAPSAEPQTPDVKVDEYLSGVRARFIARHDASFDFRAGLADIYRRAARNLPDPSCDGPDPGGVER